MQGQQKKLKQYWSQRAEGYSMVNQEELAGEQRGKWLHYLKDRFPYKAPDEVSVLDAGTGPGFFAIILAEAGYLVTAVDCTDIDAMEALARNMPLSPIPRPGWDREILSEIGFSSVRIEEDMGDQVYSFMERINYAATPLFCVQAYK